MLNVNIVVGAMLFADHFLIVVNVCSASAVAEKALQKPHGDKLVNLMLPESQKAAAVAACTKEIELSDRNACDTELLIVG